jgi:predicted amidophosphoribosyltransferase
MAIAIFLFVAVAVAATLVYPLLSGRAPAQPAPALTDDEIERAVRTLRRSRVATGLACPACGAAYQEGDRFCVRCGESLPQAAPVSNSQVCPSCGAAVAEGDRFCSKCGSNMDAGEVA